MAVAPREARYNCTNFEILTLVHSAERGSSGVLSWWIGFSQIISPSELLFGVLLLRFCVIIIYCALN